MPQQASRIVSMLCCRHSQIDCTRGMNTILPYNIASFGVLMGVTESSVKHVALFCIILKGVSVFCTLQQQPKLQPPKWPQINQNTGLATTVCMLHYCGAVVLDYIACSYFIYWLRLTQNSLHYLIINVSNKNRDEKWITGNHITP